MYTPTLLHRWTRPKHYMGAHWDGYFVGPCATHRDADSLVRSNWTAQLDAIPEQCIDLPNGDTLDTVCVVEESHWAVGWVSWLAIHETAAGALRIAEELAARLENYLVLDEDAWSSLEWDEACETWENMGVADRVWTLQQTGGNIFAARRDEWPGDSDGRLLEYLR